MDGQKTGEHQSSGTHMAVVKMTTKARTTLFVLSGRVMVDRQEGEVGRLVLTIDDRKTR